MEDGRNERSSAIEDRGQAAASLTPDIDDTDSGSLLDSFLSTLLKKMNQKIKKTFLILKLSSLESTVVQCHSCHTGAGTE